MNDRMPPATPISPTPPKAPAQLTNMRLAMEAMVRLDDPREGVERMGVLFGYSGWGKTMAAAYTCDKYDGIFLTANRTWTPGVMLKLLARELGIEHLERTAADRLDQITAALNNYRRPVVIDEFDQVEHCKWIELIRTIYDQTKVPFLLVGEESLPAKLQRRRQFHNRIRVHMPAQPCSLPDALVLRDHYCQQAHIAEDLVAAIVSTCNGVTRYIANNLIEAESEALKRQKSTITLADWGDLPIQSGQVQTRRQQAAA